VVAPGAFTCTAYTRVHNKATTLPACLPAQDTDLAMAIRRAGLDVIFQPLALNFHQEGTTFGTDATSELKQRLMAENKERFLTKWRAVLQARQGRRWLQRERGRG
jgi:hypothetical protein